jgi:hypothetical protein
MGEWDVVGTAPLAAPAPAAAPAAADPWAVVSHAPARQSDLQTLPEDIASVGRAAVGGAEDLFHHVTGAFAQIPATAVGGVAGLAQTLGAPVDAEALRQKTQNALTYQPVTDSGKAGLATEARALAPVSDFVEGSLADTGAARPYIEAAGRGASAALMAAPFAAPAAAALDTAGNRLAATGLEKPAAPASVVEGAAKPSTQTPLATARGAGYQAPPSVVQASNPADSVPGTFREKIVGPSGARGDANVTNQTLTTRLAGEELGLKDAKKITAQDAENFRKTGPGPVYDATAEKLGTIPSDASAVGELQRIASVEDPASAVPAKTATNLDRIVNRIQSGSYNGSEWRRDISWLRENKGREAANALEDMAERHLAGDTETLTAYKGARADFAKSYDYQNAIGRGGQIDAQHLRALDDKYPGMLTGNAKLIATAARELPEVTRLPGGDTGTGIHSKIQAAHNAVGGLIKKIPGMDPMSERFQTKNFGREMTPTEKSYVPSFGKRNGGPLSERPADPTGGLSLADDSGPITPPAPRGEGIPLSEVLSTGVERPAAPGLSLAPMGRPAPDGIPFTRDAGQMAGDLQLAPDSATAAPQRYTQLGQVLSQGVPEGVATRTARPTPRVPSDTVELADVPPRPDLELSAPDGQAFEAGQRQLPLGKALAKGKKAKRHGDRK